MDAKIFNKANFGTAEIAKMEVGETVIVACKDFREVQLLRNIAQQFVKYHRPKGIARYSAKTEEVNGGYNVQFSAVGAE